MTSTYDLRSPGDVLTSDQANTLMRQSIICATVADLPSDPHAGMTVWVTDQHRHLTWTVAGWWPPWGAPWGVLGHHANTVLYGLISSTVLLDGWEVTCTVPANRLLRVSQRFCLTTSVGANPRMRIKRDDGDVLGGNGWSKNNCPDEIITASDFLYDTPDAGARTYTLEVESAGGGEGFVLSSDQTPYELLVEDCGPNGAPVAP